MRGLAAELSGASDWMNVATAWLVGESGIKPYTLTTTKNISLKLKRTKRLTNKSYSDRDKV